MTYECIGKKTSQPYYIQQLCLNIYSFEELLYFLRGNAYLLDVSVINKELFDFIGQELELKDLHEELKALYRKDKAVSDYVCTILAYGHYVGEEELESIRRIIEGNTDVRPFMRRKARGDFFFQNRKYVAAAEEYGFALEESEGTEPRLYEVYHNLGMIFIKSYLFKEGGGYFRSEWELTKDKDALKRYLKAMKLSCDKEEYERIVLETDPDPEIFALAEEEIKTAEEKAKEETEQIMGLQYKDRVGFIRKAEEITVKLKNEYRMQ